VDVFLCSLDYDNLPLPFALKKQRKDFYREVLARWEEQEGIAVIPLVGADRAFQRQRRIIADIASAGNPYIVADDDCLVDPFFTEYLPQLLSSYPKFAILSWWPKNATISRWTPEYYTPYVDDQVEEHVSVGGVRLMRPGVMKQWPRMSSDGYDATQCDYLRNCSYRVGYARELYMTHLGEGHEKSTVGRID
jgi:hypothetical protein